jgi:hypothetical protein
MRASLILLIALAAGCATHNDLAPSPPPGVDLSGHWRLNVADSDDPLSLTQALASGNGTATPGQGPGGGSRSGRGSRSGGGPLPAAQQPISIPTTVVADLLRWPGAQLDIRQDGGEATFSSDGDSRFYQPTAASRQASEHAGKKGRRSAGPPVCGWSGPSLVVHTEAEDDQPGFDAHYRVSDDGTRLIQLITLQGGRLTGFTMSRVWDRE